MILKFSFLFVMSTDVNDLGIDVRSIEALLQSHNDLILAIHKAMVENYAGIKCNVVSLTFIKMFKIIY